MYQLWHGFLENTTLLTKPDLYDQLLGESLFLHDPVELHGSKQALCLFPFLLLLRRQVVCEFLQAQPSPTCSGAT